MMPKNHAKLIWIDLDNSPHVPFFKPIIDDLRKRGCEVFITARDCFQVCGLADLLGIPYRRVGRHYGKNKLMKVAGTIFRSMKLFPMIFTKRPSLAVSHGSRSQLLLSKLLRIKSVMIFDYEHSQSLVVIGPTWSFVPEVVASNPSCANLHNLVSYPGIKEDVYVPGFKPDSHIRAGLGISETEILVTIRPPATEAHYHNPASEKLFSAVINQLGQKENVRMLLLPRNKRQDAFIKSTWPALCANKNILIPDHVLDGLNLIWFSDFVVSGGGTMNREAAALGVPVYSIFKGKIGAVDKYLAQEGRLILLESVEDVYSKLKVRKREIRSGPLQSKREALNTIVDGIARIVENGSM